MFVRKVPPCIDWPTDIPDADLRYDSRVVEQQARNGAAQVAYEQFLAARDFAESGDLVSFFARDVFHESPLTLVIDGDARQVRFVAESLGAYVEGSDGQRDYRPGTTFDVTFNDVVRLELSLKPGGRNYGKYSFSEIDALEDSIASAEAGFGGKFHSLTMQVGVAQFYDEGWIQLVFRSVCVVPHDVGDWDRILSDRELHVIGLLREPDFLGSGAPA